MISRDMISAMMDLSAVQAQNTEDDVRAVVELAKEYRCIAVFTLPGLTALAAGLLKDHPGINLGGVVGFPSGGSTTPGKTAEAGELIRLGCTELDMVINVGLLRSGRLEAVQQDIQSVVKASRGAPVKVILECHYLTDEEIRTGCRLSLAAGAAYVKTGTGWAETGATPHNIALMKSEVGHKMAIKAAGGIRDLDTLLDLHRLGATRFGVGYESARKILAGLPE
jgi:deoxyribose-phosphate aldolase